MTKTPEGADISALQREVAAIIVRDVLQEDFDDLVEGYLDEIMQASLRIIRLPGYAAVARAFETNLAGAVIASSAAASRIEELEAAMGDIAEGLVPPIPHGHYLAHRHAVNVARVALRQALPDKG